MLVDNALVTLSCCLDEQRFIAKAATHILLIMDKNSLSMLKMCPYSGPLLKTITL